MMQKHYWLNKARGLCRDWERVQSRLIDEQNQMQKERLLYEAWLLERSLQHLAETYRYYYH